MRLIKIVLVIGLLGLHFSGKAQSQQEYVYQDSSMLKDTISTDSISGTIVEKATDQLLQNYTSRFQKDTVLVYNQLTVSPDSMKLLSQADTAFSTQVVDSSLRMLHKKVLNEQEDEPNQGRGGTKNHHNNLIYSLNI